MRRGAVKRALEGGRRLPRTAVVLPCCVSAAGAQVTARPMEAHLHGWGHTCSGELFLNRRTISWMSSYNLCYATGFRVVENHDTKTDLDRVYRLNHVSRDCFSRYIEVHHAFGAPGLSWDARGYTTYGAARRRDVIGTEGCLLEEVWALLPKQAR